jgi:hypothetical protein
MTMGLRAPLCRRLCILAAPLLALGIFATRVQDAGAMPLFACPHFQAVWSYVPQGFFGMTNAITVSGSTCTVGAVSNGSTSGGGTVTLEQPGGPLAGTAWENHYDLNLGVGGAAVHTVFDAVMVPFSVPVAAPGTANLSGLFDYGLAGTVQFEGATGSGVMTERCTFDPVAFVITCIDEGSFVSE